MPSITRTALATALMTVALTAAACNVPVFRYALERWRADDYQLVIAHANALSPQQTELIQQLKAAEEKSNVTVVVQRDETVETPRVALRMALPTGRTIAHWQGSLEDAAGANLFDSPARKELVKRLLAGDSVVWLLLRSTDQVRSNASRDLLAQSCARLSETIRLPQGIGEPGSELHSEVPLLVRFSAIEIDADDKQEAFLVRWLSEFRPGLLEQGEPLLVPVFGRGRALEVIPSRDLSQDLVEDLTLFLSGACSCQVKEQNPGFDLLLAVDWDTQLFGENGLRPPPAKTIDRPDQTPRTLTIPSGKRK